MNKRSILLSVLVFFSFAANAQTKLPAFFSNNMVLQQNEEVAIWGKDNPNTTIEVEGSWGKNATAVANSDSIWKLTIPTPEAGGPYTLTVDGSSNIILTDVLFGEVWLCSGQSNMQWQMKRTSNMPGQGSNEDILYSKNDRIRVFQTKRVPSEIPLYDVTGEWEHSEPSTVANFSAVAYLYGKVLEEILDVPVGLIVTCWGGSSVEAWMDEETYAKYKHLPSTKLPPERINKTPTLLYNSMIHPFVPFKMKGVIWYQGESNHKYPEDYKSLFPAMINSWRDKWQQGSFPFYFVQIAPYIYKNNVNSAFLREAQLYTMQTVENTGMAVTMDIGNCRDVHPRNKKTVADRLAYWALTKTYGVEGIEFSAPVYKSMIKTDDGKIKLSFGNTRGGITSFGKERKGFKIAGENKKFYPAQTKINRDNSITVWSKKVKNPVAVRYAFESCVEGSLFNNAGLPLSSFRTDNWKK